MVYFVFNEMKQNFRKKQSLIIIVLLILFSIRFSFTESRKPRIEKDFHWAAITYQIFNRLKGVYPEELDPKSRKSYEHLRRTAEEIGKALEEKNVREYNRLCCLSKLINAKYYVADLSPLLQTSFRRTALPIWDAVSGGLSFDEVEFAPSGAYGIGPYYIYRLDAFYYYGLYQSGHMPIQEHDLDSSLFMYRYMERILPNFLWFLILFSFGESVCRDILQGSIKLSLNHIRKRSRYLFLKWMANSLTAFVLVIFPMFLTGLFLLPQNGLTNLDYPVVYLKDGFSSFQTLPNFIEFDLEHVGSTLNYGLSAVSLIPKGTTSASGQLRFMPLYEFLGWSLLLLFAAILFYNMVTLFFSSRLNNRMSVLLVGGGTLFFLKQVSRKLPFEERLNWVPFHSDNPVRILSGTYNSNFLIAMLSLLLFGWILFRLTAFSFERRDL